MDDHEPDTYRQYAFVEPLVVPAYNSPASVIANAVTVADVMGGATVCHEDPSAETTKC